MPNYEYACADCGPFVAFRPMAEFAAPSPCPVCGAPAGRNLLSSPALGGAPAKPAPAGPVTRHMGGCGCCAPRRSLRAEAVG
jgi:putative FmdB family regulatory protein